MTVSGVSFDNFRSAACVVLGGLCGALIGLPAAATIQSATSPLLVLASFGLGCLVGYRHRRNVAFFYFALLCVCMLSGLIALSGFSSEIQGG